MRSPKAKWKHLPWCQRWLTFFAKWPSEAAQLKLTDAMKSVWWTHCGDIAPSDENALVVNCLVGFFQRRIVMSGINTKTGAKTQSLQKIMCCNQQSCCFVGNFTAKTKYPSICWCHVWISSQLLCKSWGLFFSLSPVCTNVHTFPDKTISFEDIGVYRFFYRKHFAENPCWVDGHVYCTTHEGIIQLENYERKKQQCSK